MGHKNYNKISTANAEAKIETPVETEVMGEIVVEEEKTPAEVAAETEVEEKIEEVKKTVLGVVADCAKLRVRKQPNPNAEILCEIASGSEVVIDEAASTVEFHKVTTASGAEGYCMKKFITVKA